MFRSIWRWLGWAGGGGYVYRPRVTAASWAVPAASLNWEQPDSETASWTTPATGPIYWKGTE